MKREFGHRLREEVVIGFMCLGNAKDCQKPPEIRRESWNKMFLTVFRENQHTLISDFPPLGLLENKFMLFQATQFVVIYYDISRKQT